jgi:hypothetical protein
MFITMVPLYAEIIAAAERPPSTLREPQSLS